MCVIIINVKILLIYKILMCYLFMRIPLLFIIIIILPRPMDIMYDQSVIYHNIIPLLLS